MPTIEDHLKNMPEFEGYNGSIHVGVGKAIDEMDGSEAITLELCKTEVIEVGMFPGIGQVTAKQAIGFTVIMPPHVARAFIDSLTEQLEAIQLKSFDVAGTKIEI